MARLFTSLALMVLLLSSGAQAVVFAAQVPEICDGSDCCCDGAEQEGPMLTRTCCCAVERPTMPEPERPPVYAEVESPSLPSCDAAPLSAAPAAAVIVERNFLLRPFPPRAPPVGLLRLHCVQRC